MRFTNNNEKLFPYLEEVKYANFRDLVTLENITNNFPLPHKYTPLLSCSLCADVCFYV